MEVASSISVAPAMDLDMDIDIDLDIGAMEENIPQVVKPSHTSELALVLPVTLSEEPVTHKLHIRGVDDLTTEHVTTFASEYFPSHTPKVEWIDDTSLNLVYDTSEIAQQALKSFTLESLLLGQSLHNLQLRATKPITSHPASQLQIRTAVITDRKKPRAREASRFYLTHPEYDPQERHRRGSGDYRRRKYGDQEHRARRRRDDVEGFTASMYDDDSSALANRITRRGSHSGSFSSESATYRSRHRSASPSRDDNNTAGEGSSTSHSHRRSRRRTPPPKYSARDPHPYPRENGSRELFPRDRDIGSDLRGSSARGKELFPNRDAAANLKKELFPLKASLSSGHRRSVAFDAADETADLFASRMPVPFHDGPTDDGRLRMTDPDPTPESLQVFENDGASAGNTAAGFAIRGTAGRSGGEGDGNVGGGGGFAIRGTAEKVKELFPVKAGNQGKELFGNGNGRVGKARMRADDMYF